MHLIPLGATNLLRGHLEGGPPDKLQEASAALRMVVRCPFSAPASLAPRRPLPAESKAGGGQRPEAATRCGSSEDSCWKQRISPKSSKWLWGGEILEDAQPLQGCYHICAVRGRAHPAALAAAGAWGSGWGSPGEAALEKGDGYLTAPVKVSRGWALQPPHQSHLGPGHCLGAPTCWGKSAPGWARAQASAPPSRHHCLLPAGHTQPPSAWSLRSAG